MAAVKTSTDPKRRADFLDTMEEEMRRVSEHLERREIRHGLKGRRTGELVNGYSFSEGSGAEAGARRRRINHYPRQFRPSEEDRSSTGSPDTRSPSPGPRSAPPVHPPRSFHEQLSPKARSDTSTPEAASRPAANTDSKQVQEPASPQTYVTTSNRFSRASSSSPRRTPPPVAPKPRSRGSPGPLSPLGRPRAASAPPNRPPGRAGRERGVTPDQRDEPASEMSAQVSENEALLEDSIETDPTPVPSELLELLIISPALTPEPSEPLLVIHQHHSLAGPSSSASPSSSSSLEVIEVPGKEAASPGIIEISGNFSFAKRRTLERRERSVSPITEEGETGLARVDEMVEPPDVENALLEAMMERGEGGEREEGEEGGEREEDDITPVMECAEDGKLTEKTRGTPISGITPHPSANAVVQSQPPEDIAPSDPQGPEIKTLPLMSPATGRRWGASTGSLHRRGHEELSPLVRDLQLQLREKEEELGRQRRATKRDAHEKEEQVSRLIKEGQKLEREKWELLKRARDGAERSLNLRTQLDLKETQLRSLQADLGRTRDEMMSVKSANTSLRALLTELRAPKPNREVGVQTSLEGGGTLRRNNSLELAVEELARPSSGHLERGMDFRASTTNLDRGTNHRISNCSAMSEGWAMTQGMWERHSDRWEREQSVASVASSQYAPGSREGTPTHSPQTGKKFKKKRGPLFGKLRKSAGKRGSTPTIIDGVDMSQSSLIQGRGQPPISFPYQSRLSAETQEHWRVLEQAQSIPFQSWNSKTIVAWVTTGLGMGQYSAGVREHVTAGNTMLALSDSDMDKKLGVANVLHRRKLRLAIEEQRRPDRVRYPLAGKIDCGWLAEVWVFDIGLPHLSDAMATHLVDGRVLESLTKDDLKKYFKLSKKLEQMSFLAGIELLRMHDYNREAVQEHRAGQQGRCNPQNPLYWTNRDVGDWLRDIQLGDYATNLLGSGVHGALLFLERGQKSKFSADHLAQVLQLPGSKSPARKHLTQQLARLFRDEASELIFRSPLNSFQPSQLTNSPLSPPYSLSGSLYRTGSSPSLNQTGSLAERISMEERIRHSLRESALRSVTSSISPRTPSPSSSPSSQHSHPPSPHLPCAPSPLTHTAASGTTV